MGVRKAVLLLVISVAACSQVQHAFESSSSPSAGSPVASEPRLASPAPSGVQVTASASDLPLTTVTFSCRLPVYTPDGRGAFIAFPSGTVTFDPHGLESSFDGGRYYDRAFSRWLPVSRRAVSVDGRQYAYGLRGNPADPQQSSTVHVVDVASGLDHSFGTDVPFYPYEVLDFESDGIYLVLAPEGPAMGLWRMDPSTGTITRIKELNYIEAMTDKNTLWVGSINPSDQHPIGTMFALADQLDRYGLVDGSQATWLYRPGKGVTLWGHDMAGHPIVFVQNTLTAEDRSAELVLVVDPSTQRTIITAPAEFIGSLNQPIADSNGVWFGSTNGIYLYSDAGGLQKVSNQPGFPGNGCF